MATSKKVEQPGTVRREDAARVPNEDIGNTRELRERERMRGDNGGGHREDGVPDVPHGDDGDEHVRLASPSEGARVSKRNDAGGWD